MSELTGSAIGLMVGTSLDGIDAALVDFNKFGIPEIREFQTTRFAEIEVDRLREIASGLPTTAAELSALAGAVARDHARAADAVDPDRQSRLVGAHGITVAHVPGAEPGHGWQLLNGAALAALARRDVACDFRAADIALGGQGAPLAPVADLALRMSPEEDRVILNLGGISNFTAIPADATRGRELIAGDAGPANMILDGMMRRCSGGEQGFDEDGQLALEGQPSPDLVAVMLDDPWFSRPLPRSAGREEFGDPWLDRFVSLAADLDDADRMATLVEISVRAIVEQHDRFPSEWRRTDREHLLVTGGGRHNRAVMARLRALLPSVEVATIEAIGENGDAKEAVDFAWLARQRVLELPLDLAPLSGASRNAVAGALHLGFGVVS